MKHLKKPLISKTESVIYTAAFATLALALILSLFLAQRYLVSSAQYADLGRVARYVQLCQIALEAEARATPSKQSLQKLRDIGLYVDVYPPDHGIPQPNPRYVQAIEAFEGWGYIRDPEGKPAAVIRLSRHDINTRNTIRTVRLYTLIGAIGGTILIGTVSLFLHYTIIRSLRKVSRKIDAHLPSHAKTTAHDPLERLEQGVGALLDNHAEIAARSQRLLDGHSELACLGSVDGTLHAVNAAYGRLLGKTTGELVGKNYLDLIPPSDRSEALNSLQRLSRGNPTNVAEHRIVLPDGTIRFIRWRGEAVFDTENNIVEVLSFGTDISPEKELAARFKGLEVAFDQMQSLAETGSLTWDFKANHMEWTTETRRLLGVGATGRASLEGLLAAVAPDERETVHRLFRSAQEQGSYFQHEFRVVLPDGSFRVLQSRAEVLADPRTKILNQLTCTLRDITALREAEAATKRELRFREAIEQSLAAGIVVSDEKGKNLMVNPAFCQMTGWSQEELVGITAPYPYWPPEEIPAISKAFELAISGKTPPAGFELTFCRKDRTHFDVLVKVAPLLDGKDRRLGWLGAVTDISVLQRARRELLAINERLKIAQDVVELGIWDWDPSADTLFWDRNSFAIFGRPEATDPKAVWSAVLGENERERLTYELERLIAAGAKSGQDALTIRWPDGSVHEILSTYVILRNASGQATRVVGVNRDVTAGLEEERELRNTQERLAAALEGGQFGTFEHIIGFGDLNWSQANYEINGIDPSITEPGALFEAWKKIAGDFSPELLAQINALPVTKNHYTYEFTAFPPGKEPRRVRVSTYIERSEQGHVKRLVGVSRRIDGSVSALP